MKWGRHRGGLVLSRIRGRLKERREEKSCDITINGPDSIYPCLIGYVCIGNRKVERWHATRQGKTFCTASFENIVYSMFTPRTVWVLVTMEPRSMGLYSRHSHLFYLHTNPSFVFSYHFTITQGSVVTKKIHEINSIVNT